MNLNRSNKYDIKVCIPSGGGWKTSKGVDNVYILC